MCSIDQFKVQDRGPDKEDARHLKTLQNHSKSAKIKPAAKRTILKNRAYDTIRVSTDCLRQIVLGLFF